MPIVNAPATYKYTIFPNPMAEKAKVHSNVLEEHYAGAEVKLMNLSGKTVQQFFVSDREFSIQRKELQPGVYIIQVETGENKIVEKLIIQ